MAYLLDDGWDNSGPVARAGNACFGLYSRCGIWSSRNTSDGFVPGEIAHGYGSPEQARKLVDVGLWVVVDGGYLAVDYLKLNPSAETVSKRRKAESERKARWRDNAAKKRKAQSKKDKDGPRGTGRGTPASQDAGQDAEVTSPLSFSSKEEKGGRSPASQGDASVPDDERPFDWREQKPFSLEPDPETADAVKRGAAAARAAIKKPSRFERRPGPEDPLAEIDNVLAELSKPDKEARARGHTA